MEDFIVSARKYRPQTFETVVGQGNITDTLLKAVTQNQLAQAFLFSGPRGVGKTTCARILARTVNEHALGYSDADEDFAFNIFELDAASNNSVDDIRSLIDQVRVPPQVGKYKVYIIDEVHMLSTNAFNAFLKTLEEPPAYAIFILATTEKHKVLPTILSRCQVFDFSRIQIPQMVQHLQDIASREGIEADSDALHIIAEKADGAMRDALSIFDQMVSFAGKKVRYEDVITNLNVLDYDYYFNLVDSFMAGDRAASLVTFNSIVNRGFDAHNFVIGLANHFRNLLFCVDAATTAILEVGDNVKERYLKQSAACDVRFLLNGINILSDTDSNYKNSRNQRLLVELALLKLSNIGSSIEKKNPDGEDLSFNVQAQKPAGTTVSVKSSTNTTPKTIFQNADDKSTASKTVSENVLKSESALVQPSRESHVSIEEVASEAGGNEIPKRTVAEPVEIYESASEKNSEPVLGKADVPVLPTPNAGFSSRLANRRTKGVPSLHDNGLPLQDARSKGPDEEGEASEGYSQRPATPFNLAQLWEHWDAYAAEVREQDRQSYYATLTKRRPVVREENKIELIIDNHVQLADLENDKTNLLSHLREKLNNWHIQLEGIIEEDESTDDLHLYTPEDRFKAMVETNPALGVLRQQFDLDLEHD